MAHMRCVIFQLFDPQAHRVFLAGDFNHWEPLTCPLQKDERGIWKAAVHLEPRDYEYRFVVDGQWRNSPDARQMPNPYGTYNCLLHVN